MLRDVLSSPFVESMFGGRIGHTQRKVGSRGTAGETQNAYIRVALFLWERQVR